MIYLSGVIRPDLEHERLGWMMTPKMGNRVPERGWWAADNGCFTDPTGFSWDQYERWLVQKQGYAADRLLFATAPDVPFDAEGTMARFDRYIDRMRQTVPRTALVTQDGMHPEDLRWNELDAVFVGGTTEWKMGQESAAICLEARRRGKWVHMGRVNSLKRLRVAQSMGADSADGTVLKHDQSRPVTAWLEAVARQPAMAL